MLVSVSKGTQAVKLLQQYLQFLTGCRLTQVDPYNDHNTVEYRCVIIIIIIAVENDIFSNSLNFIF